MSIEPPDSLPEGWVGKPKDDYTPDRHPGCSSLVALALLFAVFVVLVGMVALLIYDPGLIEKILDYPNLSQTRQALDQQATQLAADSLATQNALGTQGAILRDAGTQAANELIATQTAQALDSAFRATQAAFRLQATQTAVNLYATQVQAVLEQQSIQLQLNQTATQLAINAEMGQIALEQNATATAAANANQPTPPARQP